MYIEKHKKKDADETNQVKEKVDILIPPPAEAKKPVKKVAKKQPVKAAISKALKKKTKSSKK